MTHHLSGIGENRMHHLSAFLFCLIKYVHYDEPGQIIQSVSSSPFYVNRNESGLAAKSFNLSRVLNVMSNWNGGLQSTARKSFNLSRVLHFMSNWNEQGLASIYTRPNHSIYLEFSILCQIGTNQGWPFNIQP